MKDTDEPLVSHVCFHLSKDVVLALFVEMNQQLFRSFNAAALIVLS